MNVRKSFGKLGRMVSCHVVSLSKAAFNYKYIDEASPSERTVLSQRVILKRRLLFGGHRAETRASQPRASSHQSPSPLLVESWAPNDDSDSVPNATLTFLIGHPTFPKPLPACHDNGWARRRLLKIPMQKYEIGCV